MTHARRYDVLLKADQPVGNYWLSAVVVNGSRTGSPAGYGVLRYAGADNGSLPEQPPPQPESVAPWDLSTYQKVRARARATAEGVMTSHRPV